MEADDLLSRKEKKQTLHLSESGMSSDKDKHKNAPVCADKVNICALAIFRKLNPKYSSVALC